MTSSVKPRRTIVTERLSQVPRKERIAEWVLQHDFVAAKDLARLFAISIMTVHRDLDELEAQGIVRKVHGGATPPPLSRFEHDIRQRMETARAEKQALANFAVEQIEPGQAVMLDDSTTALAAARLLPRKAPLTIITNFVAVMRELGATRGIRVVLLGGEYMPQSDSLSGRVSETSLASLQADVLLMSTAAVRSGVAFQPRQEDAIVKGAMMAHATRRVLLIDHSKLGHVALHRLAPLRDFDLVVVDSGVDEEGLRELEEVKSSLAIAPLR